MLAGRTLSSPQAATGRSETRQRWLTLHVINVDVNIYIYIYRRGLNRHFRRNHTARPVFSCDQCERSFARSSNLEKHKRASTGGQVAVAVVAPAAKKRCIGVAPEIKLRKTRK